MSVNLPRVIPIKKWWLATLLTGVFLGGTLLSRAETPDSFKRYGLPIPGAYFADKESQKAANPSC